jgi:hypothetical protein
VLSVVGFDQSPPGPEISRIKKLFAESCKFPAFSRVNIPVGLICNETPPPGQYSLELLKLTISMLWENESIQKNMNNMVSLILRMVLS